MSKIGSAKPVLATLVQSALLRTNLLKKRPNPTVFYLPGLTNSSPIVTERMNQLYGDISKKLEDNYDVIVKEYMDMRMNASSTEALDSDYEVDDQKLHKGTWKWQSYIQKGERKSDFAKLCPVTAGVLESFSGDQNRRPSLMTDTPFSFAFFSTMGRISEIAPHCGPCNVRIRCHFPLVVPNGDLGMEVGGVRTHWEEGKALFFDDSYEHHVWNRTDHERVVLLFDLWHPELEAEEVEAIKDMFEFAKQEGWLK